MDVAVLVLRYVEAVVWPVVTLVVAWCLRGYLREAFGRMTRIETPAGAIEFEAEARHVRERAEEMGQPPPIPYGQVLPRPGPYGRVPPAGPYGRVPESRPAAEPSRQAPTPYPADTCPAPPRQTSPPYPASPPYPRPFPDGPAPAGTGPGMPAPDGPGPQGPAPGGPVAQDADSGPWGAPPGDAGPAAPAPRAAEAEFRDSWEVVEASPLGALVSAWATLTAALDAELPPLPQAAPAAWAGCRASGLLPRLRSAGASAALVTVYEQLRRLRGVAVDDGAPVSTSAARHFVTSCERILAQVRGQRP